jgi:simple sugar transport system ATP-binding protein
MMVGREIELRQTKRRQRYGQPVLEVQGLSAFNDDGKQLLDDVSLTVREGEILGIAGVSGNGQKDLFDVLVGVKKATQGKAYLSGEEFTNKRPKEIMDLGLASIPEDRIGQGLILTFPIEENLILGMEGESRFRRGPLLNYSKIRDFGWECLFTYGIKAPTPEFISAILSGGNLQRLILARELSQERKCLLASQPTRGLDVGGMEYVRKRLLDQRRVGKAILLIADDLDEVLELSDRIMVMYKGRIVGEVRAAEAEREKIGLMMAGVV